MRTARLKTEHAALPANDDDDASSAFLLCAARQLLRDADGHSDDDRRSGDAPAIGDFTSFQALLQAATTVATAAAQESKAQPPASASVASSSNVNAHTKKRRERNRISCRKTRLKRKVEQMRADTLARKRSERNAYLQDLDRWLQLAPSAAEESSSSLSRERERIARQFVVQSVHFALMDAAYDASWCFAAPAQVSAKASRTKRTLSRPFETLLTQWEAVTAAYEVADLVVVDVSESATSDPDADGAELQCAWRIAGVTKHDLSLGTAIEHVVSGETTVRFSRQRIVSTDLRLTSPLSLQVVVV